jgi:hypothetical protein
VSLRVFGIVLILAGCNLASYKDDIFDRGKVVGVNKNKNLEEASGLAASVRYPRHFWTHNDSGNPAEIFLLDSVARTRMVFRFPEIQNRDWEDIALGPGPDENKKYVYVGDIGDNLGRYPYKYIYRTPEPSIDEGDLIQSFDTLIIKLDGDIRDMEAMMVDPLSKNLYLISKREKPVRLFEVPYPFDSDTLVAKEVGSIDMSNINAADISPDGSEVLIKNYDHIYYWKKSGAESIVDLLKNPPVMIPYDPEPQGEAIAFSRDRSGFYTLSENGKGERARLYFYKRR